MSLFTALVPPPEALAHLAAAVEPVRVRWPELRWVRRERWHLTVAFLGEVPDDVVPRVVAATAEAVAGVPLARVQLAGAGQFPGRGGPLRVLWVGARGVPDGLARASEEAARACGIELERRERVPHLTLARAPGRRAPRDRDANPRPGEGDRGPVAALAAYSGPGGAVPALCLLRSRPGSGGPYEAVARFPLAPGEQGERDADGV